MLEPCVLSRDAKFDMLYLFWIIVTKNPHNKQSIEEQYSHIQHFWDVWIDNKLHDGVDCYQYISGYFDCMVQTGQVTAMEKRFLTDQLEMFRQYVLSGGETEDCNWKSAYFEPGDDWVAFYDTVPHIQKWFELN